MGGGGAKLRFFTIQCNVKMFLLNSSFFTRRAAAWSYNGSLPPSFFPWDQFENQLNKQFEKQFEKQLNTQFEKQLNKQFLLGYFFTWLVIVKLSFTCLQKSSPNLWRLFHIYFFRPWMTPYMLPCIQLTLTGSVWTTVAVSIERYLSVCRGYRSDRVHLFYTAPILFFSIFFNAPRVLEMYTGYVNVTRKFLGYYFQCIFQNSIMKT